MEPAERLPFVARLDDTYSPGGVIDAFALGPFVAGTQPWARTRWLQRVRPEARLLPDGVEPTRVAKEYNSTIQLAEGDGWTLWSSRSRDRTANVHVTAATDLLARRVMNEATRDATEPEPCGSPRQVTIGFWHQVDRGRGRRVERTVDAARWPDIRANYARTVARSLQQLVLIDPDNITGRLVLLHGPPGTGKTTALRALAHAWDDWCRVDFVLDPDLLFREVGYLMDVLLDADSDADDEDGDGDGDTKRWRLLVLEDCDELIRSDAKQGAGQSLSRLLNLTDGVIGQGLRVLICITTNEDLRRLHPAVTRPGRCLAQIDVGPLPRDEAVAWLGHPDGIGPAGATLAELYARRGHLHKVEQPEPERRIGQYL